GPDGMAHAHADNRTACHVPPIAEPYAWPTLSRCPACLRAVDTSPKCCHACDRLSVALTADAAARAEVREAAADVDRWHHLEGKVTP
ncbi:MAG TPA: hypothetical protein VIK13_06805, partial [Candidatus Limnocylindrales bacterium]